MGRLRLLDARKTSYRTPLERLLDIGRPAGYGVWVRGDEAMRRKVIGDVFYKKHIYICVYQKKVVILRANYRD